MTYEEAIAYITPHPSSNVIQFTGNKLKDAVKAIKEKVEELEERVEDFGEVNRHRYMD